MGIEGHELEPRPDWHCSCGEWTAQLGEMVIIGFDKHLVDVLNA